MHCVEETSVKKVLKENMFEFILPKCKVSMESEKAFRFFALIYV